MHDVVGGGGSAGCVVATRLSAEPSCKVLLLEAGPDLRAGMPEDVRDGWRPTRSFDWGYAAEPDEYGVVRELPRGRLLGGCSSMNATFALRGSPADYDGWAHAGNTGWSFADVLPYFTRLERDTDFGHEPWHDDSGPIPIRRYGSGELTEVAAAGLEAFEALGVARVPDHNAPGARPNLTVRCETQVADIVFDGDRAVGVRLLDASAAPTTCSWLTHR